MSCSVVLPCVYVVAVGFGFSSVVVVATLMQQMLEISSYGNTPTVFARDRKAWSKSVYIDAQGNRPSMVDRNMVDLIGTLKTDTLHKATIATSVARSPLK